MVHRQNKQQEKVVVYMTFSCGPKGLKTTKEARLHEGRSRQEIKAYARRLQDQRKQRSGESDTDISKNMF